MGFFSDLFEGNFGNLWHDITADPIAEVGLLGGVGLAAPFLLPEIGAGLGLFGAGEAAGGLGASALGGALEGGAAAGEAALAPGLAAGAGSSALAFGETGAGLGATEGQGAISTALEGPFSTPAASSNLTAMTDINALYGGGLGQAGGVSPLASVAPDAGAGLGGTAGMDAGTAGANLLGGASGDVSGGVAGASDPSFLGQLGNNIVGQVMKNPLGTGLGAAGLGYTMLKGNQLSPEAQQMQQLAKQGMAQGQQLESYLASGKLPPGLQSSVDQAVAAAKARAIQNAAAQGQSTNPAFNSTLAADLNGIQQRAIAEQAKLATGLYQMGLQELQLTEKMLETLGTWDRADQKALGDAIMNFAKALSPSNTVALNFGGGASKSA